MKTKLVRDNIPDIRLVAGKKVEMRMAAGREYEFMLLRKLQEEVEEFMLDRSAAELADVLEVMHCLADLKEIPWAEVEEIRLGKKVEFGSFKKKIIIEGDE